MSDEKVSGRPIKGGAIQPVAILGASGDGRDDISLATRVMTGFHGQVHAGNAFVCSSLDINLADDGTIIFAMTPDTLFDHFVFKGACGGDATIELLEGATFTDGAAYDPRNLKRTEPGLSTVSVILNPTVTDDGFVVYEDLIPGGTGGNASGGAAALRENFEFIYVPGTVYVARLKNIAGGAKAAALVVSWYERTLN